jgi:hypothetical protein
VKVPNSIPIIAIRATILFAISGSSQAAPPPAGCG